MNDSSGLGASSQTMHLATTFSRIPNMTDKQTQHFPITRAPILPLPQDVAERIAAGEVIERVFRLPLQ